MKRISEELIIEARKLRENGETIETIAKKLKIDRETATKYTKDIMLSREQKYEIRSNISKIYNYNISAFTDNNEISYYLLGAYMTDGNLSKSSYGVSLVSKDYDWVESIKNIICHNKPIFTTTNKYYTLNLTNLYIYDWLVSNGCTPAKSLTLKFPQVPKQYLIDFIRGCFDGDGCFCVYNKKGSPRPKYYSYISSASQEFIEFFKLNLESLGIKCTVNKCKLCNSKINDREIIAKNNLFRLHLNQTETVKLINTIYYKDCLCMKRKEEKCKEIIKISKEIKK